MSLFVITESGGWDDPDVILGAFATLSEAQAAIVSAEWLNADIVEFDGTIHAASYYRARSEWVRTEEPNTCDWSPRPALRRPTLLDFMQKALVTDSPTESAFWKGLR